MDLHLPIDGDDCIGNATKRYRSVDLLHNDVHGTYSNLTGRAIFATEVGMVVSYRKKCRVIAFVDCWWSFQSAWAPGKEQELSEAICQECGKSK